MQSSPIYSFISLDHELWAGGENMLLYYNGKKDFWKTIGESKVMSGGIVWDLCIDDHYLWMATSRGLDRLDMSTHSIDRLGIEKYFSNTQVFPENPIPNNTSPPSELESPPSSSSTSSTSSASSQKDTGMSDAGADLTLVYGGIVAFIVFLIIIFMVVM